MLKNQQFFIFKVSSDRLKKSNYNIEISVDNAKKNSEIITINNSELIRTLFKFKKINFNQKELDDLLILKKKIKKAENTERNKKKLYDITQKIEKMLFIEDLVNIEFKNKSHYLTILKQKGFYINGIRFTPFMASAGMIRKNTAMFINNNIKHQIMDILENNRNESVPIAPSKFGAYFSLYSSSTLPVSFPNFAVIPDKEIESIRNIDFVTYKGVGEDDNVTNMTTSIKSNAWDGQGLISPRLAKKWSDEIELDYTFSGAIIRAPYLKGLVVAFDFHKFAEEIAKTFKFKDIYGEEQDIREVDLIISESMFKLWNGYDNLDDYIEKCDYNDLGFSIAKVNPKKEKAHSRTSYQFLQVLDLNNVDIAKLCEPTINWFRSISGESQQDMVIYSAGEHPFEQEDFERLDVSLKAILINPELATDRYIQKRYRKSLGKKKKESYMGSILINANYQFMMADPYYQACHLFNLSGENLPLLNDGEHYSEYWLNKNVEKVVAVRSPIVHHSELGILTFKNDNKVKEWYGHIHSGIIFPANGIGMDCAIHGGADFDGDLICTINNEIFMKGRIPGVPIMYTSKNVEKKVVDSRDDEEQVTAQLKGYNSKVGFATNISSSLYSMLSEFRAGSEEYNTIQKRLKIGRVIQGEIIDGVKGLDVPPFRNHWTKITKISTDTPEEEKKKLELFNRIACRIRPAFFRFLYSHYMTDYNKEIKKYNLYSYLKFEKPFKDIFSAVQKTPEEEGIVNSYCENTFFLDNDSVVNEISRYMRTNIALINRYSTRKSKECDWTILKNKTHELNPYYVSLMRDYLQEYKAFKMGLRHDLLDSYGNLEGFISYLKKECSSSISSNESELADYALEVTYNGELGMVEFAWNMFEFGLLENILKNSSGTFHFPIQDDNGDIEYLWNTYSLKEFSVEDL